VYVVIIDKMCQFFSNFFKERRKFC